MLEAFARTVRHHGDALYSIERPDYEVSIARASVNTPSEDHDEQAIKAYTTGHQDVSGVEVGQCSATPHSDSPNGCGQTSAA
jgi:hypothetical protein